MKQVTVLNELADVIHKTAADHGFWETERNMGEMIALIHSELSEALEEHRANKPPAYYVVSVSQNTMMTPDTHALINKIRGGDPAVDPNGPSINPALSDDDYRTLVRAGIAKPEGAGVELADCVIRILDTLQSLDVDIDRRVVEIHKLDELSGIRSMNAYAALIDSLEGGVNFGENLAFIHKRLGLGFGCWMDGHRGSAVSFLVMALTDCLEAMRDLGVDIDATVAEKMAFNDSRPYKHNKEY